MKKENCIVFFFMFLSGATPEISENQNVKIEKIKNKPKLRMKKKPKSKTNFFLLRIYILTCFIVIFFCLCFLIYRITRQKKAILEKENQGKDQKKTENLQKLLQDFYNFFIEYYCEHVTNNTFEFSKEYRLKIKEKPVLQNKPNRLFGAFPTQPITGVDVSGLLEKFSQKTFFFYGDDFIFVFDNDNSFLVPSYYRTKDTVKPSPETQEKIQDLKELAKKINWLIFCQKFSQRPHAQ